MSASRRPLNPSVPLIIIDDDSQQAQHTINPGPSAPSAPAPVIDLTSIDEEDSASAPSNSTPPKRRRLPEAPDAAAPPPAPRKQQRRDAAQHMQPNPAAAAAQNNLAAPARAAIAGAAPARAAIAGAAPARAAGAGAVAREPPHASHGEPMAKLLGSWSKDSKRAKCWRNTLSNMESDKARIADTKQGTWFLGYTDSGYGKDIAQACCNDHCLNCSGSAANLKTKSPILYSPAIADFDHSEPIPRQPWHRRQHYTQGKKQMLGCIYACSPACAKQEQKEPPANLHPSSPCPHMRFEVAEVKLDKRLQQHIDNNTPLPLKFKQQISSLEWRAVFDALPSELRALIQQRNTRQRKAAAE